MKFLAILLVAAGAQPSIAQPFGTDSVLVRIVDREGTIASGGGAVDDRGVFASSVMQSVDDVAAVDARYADRRIGAEFVVRPRFENGRAVAEIEVRRRRLDGVLEVNDGTGVVKAPRIAESALTDVVELRRKNGAWRYEGPFDGASRIQVVVDRIR